MESSRAPAALGLRLLREIGDGLDRDEYPIVHENGLVLPGPGLDLNSPGKDKSLYVSQPEAGSPGPAARQGQGAPARGSSAAGAQALVLGQPGLSDVVRRDLGVAIAAYPDARSRFAPPVAWLVTPIRPIQGLPDVAYLVTCYSLEPGVPIPGRHRPVASWAWWDMGIWIGPRHTNFPDGSICAFEPTHDTWSPGKGLLLWLDLHAVWIARQLYLRYFGRWPGDQVLHTALERLREHRPGELCGCGSFRRYDDCHRAADLTMGGYLRHREFYARYPNPVRNPDPEARSMLESMLRSRHDCR